MLSKMEQIQSTIMFTDVVGSSALWNKHPPKVVLDALVRHENQMKKLVEKKCQGLVTRMIGDAFMCEFPGLVHKPEYGLYQALRCAIYLQKDLAKHPIMIGDDTLQIRIGLAFGYMFKRPITLQGCTSFDYFGDAVNIAARMESKVAQPGGIAFTMVESEPDKFLQKEMKLVKKLQKLKGIQVTGTPYIHDSQECEKQMDLIRKRSERLLKSQELFLPCMNAQDLKIGNRPSLRTYQIRIISKRLTY